MTWVNPWLQGWTGDWFGAAAAGGAVANADALESYGSLGPVEAIGYTPPQEQEDLGGALRRYLRGAKKVPVGWKPPELPAAEKKTVPAPVVRGDQAEVLPFETMAHVPHAQATGGSEASAVLAAGRSQLALVLAAGGSLAEVTLNGTHCEIATTTAHGVQNPEDDEIALLMAYLQEVA